MFDFLKRKKNQNNEVASENTPIEPVEKDESTESTNVAEKVPSKSTGNYSAESSKVGLFSRLKKGLSKTRGNFTAGVGNLVLGKKTIDADLLESIEDQLLMADVGIEACQQIIENLTERVSRKQLNDAGTLIKALKENLCGILQPSEKPLDMSINKKPYVILMVGVNGAGKTTTIGKLAKQFQNENKKVMLAAGDTFRAAAIEQLQAWGLRNQITVIAQKQGSDSASVAYDALEAAKARQADVLIVDTAGRLHTQANLMQELQKIKRVLAKLELEAPHEVLLVLDAGNGQNALNQARQFQQAVGVSGIVLTKLDGTAKGGIIFAIAKNLSIPIRFIGVGERIEDLHAFNAKEFVEALFNE